MGTEAWEGSESHWERWNIRTIRARETNMLCFARLVISTFCSSVLPGAPDPRILHQPIWAKLTAIHSGRLKTEIAPDSGTLRPFQTQQTSKFWLNRKLEETRGKTKSHDCFMCHFFTAVFDTPSITSDLCYFVHVFICFHRFCTFESFLGFLRLDRISARCGHATHGICLSSVQAFLSIIFSEIQSHTIPSYTCIQKKLYLSFVLSKRASNLRHRELHLWYTCFFWRKHLICFRHFPFLTDFALGGVEVQEPDPKISGKVSWTAESKQVTHIANMDISHILVKPIQAPIPSA